MSVHLTEHYGVLDTDRHQFVHQCTLVAQAVLMVADTYHHNLRMLFQAWQVFVTGGAKLQYEEFKSGIAVTDKRGGIIGIYREYVLHRFRISLRHFLVYVEIDDIFLLRVRVGGHLSTYIDIVGLVWFSLVCYLVGDDNRHILTTDILHSDGIAAFRTQIVEILTFITGYKQMSCTL